MKRPVDERPASRKTTGCGEAFPQIEKNNTLDTASNRYLLFGGLVLGLTDHQVEKATLPGHRLRQMLYSMLFVTLLIGLVSVLFGKLVLGLVSELSDELVFTLVFTLVAGLIYGLFFGYGSLIQHYLLRWQLTWHQSLPRQLIPFLERAVGLTFLRRVGESYIFVHRLLMEHFAQMDV